MGYERTRLGAGLLVFTAWWSVVPFCAACSCLSHSIRVDGRTREFTLGGTRAELIANAVRALRKKQRTEKRYGRAALWCYLPSMQIARRGCDVTRLYQILWKDVPYWSAFF